MKETRIYKQIDNCSISADIYYQGTDTPVILYIHSGALIFGTREWLPTAQIEYLTNAGFSLVNIDYRLAPETKFEIIIEDIRDAIEWVRTKAIEWYDFDIDNIAVMGSSAGGYLSLLTGTMDYKPKAIISFYGYGDILGTWYTEPSEYYCKKPMISRSKAIENIGFEETTDGKWDRIDFYYYCRQQGVWVQEVTKMDPNYDLNKLMQYNPINNISNDYPPTLFLHGDQDTDVPYEQSVKMYEKLKEIGIETKLITIEGADHVFDHDFEDPKVQGAFIEVVDFLKTHLCK
ncbi:alpha/beta hydrolase fold domain-containing protein [Paenibacillus timonensis]|nr:alpha/beta hydrolase [Paenibacillus timonensis]MUG86496.1 alpha/beta hydrolase fold domain-containing protein [Paenibacillus timonensis]